MKSLYFLVVTGVLSGCALTHEVKGVSGGELSSLKTGATATGKITCENAVGPHDYIVEKDTKFSVKSLKGQKYKTWDTSQPLDAYAYLARGTEEFADHTLYLYFGDGNYGIDKGFVINPDGEWAYKEHHIAQIDVGEVWTLFKSPCTAETSPPFKIWQN